MAITNAWLKANSNKSIDKAHMVADRDGLNIRVSKKGTLTFTMRYRFAGKPDQLALGTYPEMSLSDARKKNDDYRAKLAEGINPKQQKANELRSNIEALTVEDLFNAWFEKNVKGHNSQANEKQRVRMFNNHVFARFGKRIAKDVTLHEWLDQIESIQEKTPSVSMHLLGYLKQMYNFGVIRELVPNNPVVNISATRDLKIETNVRERYLENNELKLVLGALEDGVLNKRYELFHILCLFFGCRPAEIRRAKKSDFDFDKMVWTVPKENHKIGKKTKKPLIRPIIPEVIPVLEELFSYSPSELAICKTEHRKKCTTKKIGDELAESFCSYHGDKINKRVKKLYDVDLETWSIYALRKTMRTNMARISEETKGRVAPFHVCEIMLGHKPPGVVGVYDKNLYLDQQKEAYSAWWARIERIKTDADNVKTVKFG